MHIESWLYFRFGSCVHHLDLSPLAHKGSGCQLLDSALLLALLFSSGLIEQSQGEKTECITILIYSPVNGFVDGNLRQS